MKKKNERGMALVTAMAAALIISATAIAVLNMTLRRFELSAFRSDHAIALAEAEAGTRYVFARLGLDQTFRDAVLAKPAGENYILRCHGTADAVVLGLHMGAVDAAGAAVSGKHVEMRISHDAATPPRFTVRARADYGTGN